MLRHLCSKHTAHIVISSTWRHFADITGRSPNQFKNLLFDNLTDGKLTDLLHDDWKTVDLHRFNHDTVRGDEIAEWLGRHPEVTNYAIIDDDPDMLPAQLSHFIHVNGVNGLQFEDYKSIDRILAGEIEELV